MLTPGLQGASLFIADEAHHLGAEQQRQSYPEHVPFRLALSATPDRWFDDAGTLALRDYFGATVFSFTLEQAIGVSLTNYYYYPHQVELTDEEMDRYAELSAKIARMAHRDDADAQEALRMLLIKRADLLNNAEHKLTELARLMINPDEVAHALFSCAPGQIDAVLRLLGIEDARPQIEHARPQIEHACPQIEHACPQIEHTRLHAKQSCLHAKQWLRRTS